VQAAPYAYDWPVNLLCAHWLLSIAYCLLLLVAYRYRLLPLLIAYRLLPGSLPCASRAADRQLWVTSQISA